jgi:hypothetical protein
MNIRSFYFSNKVDVGTQTDIPIEHTHLIDKMYSVYTSVYEIEEMKKEISELRRQLEIEQREKKELKDTLDAIKRKDFITGYHMIRQKKAFPFTPVLSKLTPLDHTETSS